jgi:hypothetical protein
VQAFKAADYKKASQFLKKANNVLKSLGGGLDAEAIKAAKNIQFLPAIVNGIPTSIVKRIEYTFAIY